MGKLDWQNFEPDLTEGSRAIGFLLSFAAALSGHRFDAPEAFSRLAEYRAAALAKRSECEPKKRQAFTAAVYVLGDLAKQGWSVRKSRTKGVQVARPAEELDPDKLRCRIRAQLHAERDSQLRLLSTQAFIKDMERKRPYGNFPSIFSLMRDGGELAERLQGVLALPNKKQSDALAKCVEPYLQFVTEKGVCEHTGLRLMDIWRYFRHTWATPYKSVPGRTLMAIIRDSAAPHHPVIGIGALSSAAVAITARDELLGWTASSVLDRMSNAPSRSLSTWINRTLNTAIDEIYRIDFLEDRTLSPSNISSPTEAVIARLKAVSELARNEHHRYMQSTEYKKDDKISRRDDEDWLLQARTPLFRSKRAAELASLLEVRRVLARITGGNCTPKSLPIIAADPEGKDVVAKLVRRAKSERVGTAIADLTICGAVPPYNELLAGKLVSLLMVGPEVVRQYRSRYVRNPSVIASSMAGQSVVRPAHLVYVGTTSLYGQRPCQYDRISFRFDNPTPQVLRYQYLGKTKGIGTFQFGDDTVVELAKLLAQSNEGQRINSVFGEGVNPRLRKIRSGLELLGLDSDVFLDHGAPRLVYGVELVRNTKDFLLGITSKPDSLFNDCGNDLTSRMVSWWLGRWVLGRIGKEGVLERIGEQRVNSHPIRHAARIKQVTVGNQSTFEE